MTVTLANAYDANNTSGTGQSSLAATCSNAQTAGNVNVVQVGWHWPTTDPGISSVTDSKGNSYVLVGSVLMANGTDRVSTYKALNIAAATAGANVVTVTWGSANAQFPTMMVTEIAGATDVAQYADGTQSPTTTPTTSTLTVTNAGSLGICFSVSTGHNTASGSGWTAITGVNPDASGAWGEQQTFASAGGSATGTTTSNSGTCGISMVLLAFLASFKSDPLPAGQILVCG